ncbi:hypothetical protein CAOG_04339 [Capsaspora owczarzaki ATCC 30864]|uniref:Uncharacterized protein n=1 Tax=Capsaspora owczarzaki (strain ATCC 30864) TaxID=595528 RepID=A0A0D2VRQ1_CAPO3|nr:hypothetical protein CAOG_04339 [Capsaspora owczarzaki ATCC 30864]KJE93572.1 hypothetical protein CAOG_004339 [Capsaspora owczarzaki ATCC 30864]|eukprot:XP_004348167.1 hypothetical protein CAOG_04339 [Capsaspora owczarzaki ATCC 30864]
MQAMRDQEEWVRGHPLPDTPEQQPAKLYHTEPAFVPGFEADGNTFRQDQKPAEVESGPGWHIENDVVVFDAPANAGLIESNAGSTAESKEEASLPEIRQEIEIATPDHKDTLPLDNDRVALPNAPQADQPQGEARGDQFKEESQAEQPKVDGEQAEQQATGVGSTENHDQQQLPAAWPIDGMPPPREAQDPTIEAPQLEHLQQEALGNDLKSPLESDQQLKHNNLDETTPEDSSSADNQPPQIEPAELLPKNPAGVDQQSDDQQIEGLQGEELAQHEPLTPTVKISSKLTPQVPPSYLVPLLASQDPRSELLASMIVARRLERTLALPPQWQLAAPAGSVLPRHAGLSAAYASFPFETLFDVKHLNEFVETVAFETFRSEFDTLPDDPAIASSELCFVSLDPEPAMSPLFTPGFFGDNVGQFSPIRTLALPVTEETSADDLRQLLSSDPIACQRSFETGMLPAGTDCSAVVSCLSSRFLAVHFPSTPLSYLLSPSVEDDVKDGHDALRVAAFLRPSKHVSRLADAVELLFEDSLICVHAHAELDSANLQCPENAAGAGSLEKCRMLPSPNAASVSAELGKAIDRSNASHIVLVSNMPNGHPDVQIWRDSLPLVRLPDLAAGIALNGPPASLLDLLQLHQPAAAISHPTLKHSSTADLLADLASVDAADVRVLAKQAATWSELLAEDHDLTFFKQPLVMWEVERELCNRAPVFYATKDVAWSEQVALARMARQAKTIQLDL